MTSPVERWFIDRLLDPGVSESDKSGCLDVLAILAPFSERLGQEALAALTAVIADPMQASVLRDRALNVAHLIEPDFGLTQRI
jgi:hypothetical protein